MDTIKQRLVSFLAYKGIGQTKFEEICGLSRGYVAKIGVSIGADKVLQICSAFPDLSRDWLLAGEGSMLKDTQDTPPVSVGNVGGSVVGAVGVGNRVERVEVPPAVPSGDVGRLVDLLACQISKKDEQIDRKDEQIFRLLSVLENLGGGAK